MARAKRPRLTPREIKLALHHRDEYPDAAVVAYDYLEKHRQPKADPRTCCRFCFVKFGERVPAAFVAPQHDGGDEDRPAVWVPACRVHFDGWHEDLPADEQLPTFRLKRRRC